MSCKIENFIIKTHIMWPLLLFIGNRVFYSVGKEILLRTLFHFERRRKKIEVINCCISSFIHIMGFLSKEKRNINHVNWIKYRVQWTIENNNNCNFSTIYSTHQSWRDENKKWCDLCDIFYISIPSMVLSTLMASKIYSKMKTP